MIVYNSFSGVLPLSRSLFTARVVSDFDVTGASTLTAQACNGHHGAGHVRVRN